MSQSQKDAILVIVDFRASNDAEKRGKIQTLMREGLALDEKYGEKSLRKGKWLVRGHVNGQRGVARLRALEGDFGVFSDPGVRPAVGR